MADLRPVQRPVSSLPIVAKLSIPGSPDWVGVGPQDVWISNKAKDSVSQIDPVTNRLVANIHVGRAPCSGLTVGFGSVWVPSCADRRIDRIDVGTNRVVATIPTTVGHSEGGIAVGEGGVWFLSDQRGTLLHISPELNEIVARMDTAPGSFVPAVGGGSIWVTSTSANLVSRIDPQTHHVRERIAVGPSPRFLCFADDAIWTLNQGDGTVSRVDAKTNRVVATIEVGVPGPGGDIAAGEGFVWVTAINVPLTQIDPKTNKVVVQFVGEGGDALRIGHRSAWLCSFFLQQLWRVPLPL